MGDRCASMLVLPAGATAQGLDTTCQFALTRLDATHDERARGGHERRLLGRHLRRAARHAHPDRGPVPARPLHELERVRRGRAADRRALRRPAAPTRAARTRSCRRRTASARYTAFIEVGPKPAQPAPNTLYSGDSRGGTFLYRVYVPDRGPGREGRRAAAEGDASSRPAAPAARRASTRAVSCRRPTPRQLNEPDRGRARASPDPTDDGNGYPGPQPAALAAVQEPLRRRRWTSCSTTRRARSSIRTPTSRCGDGPGFLSNRDIAYVFTATLPRLRRAAGAARARDLRRYAHGPAEAERQQLRYWSFCQYEPATQRVIACRWDDRVKVGPRGYYKIVVSTADQRPAERPPRAAE